MGEFSGVVELKIPLNKMLSEIIRLIESYKQTFLIILRMMVCSNLQTFHVHCCVHAVPITSIIRLLLYTILIFFSYLNIYIH